MMSFAEGLVLSDGSRYLGVSLSALRQHVEGFREDEPEAYSVLDSRIKTWEAHRPSGAQDFFGNLAGVAGLGAMVVSFLPPYDVLLMVGGSLLVVTAAVLTSEPVLTETDVIDFVNLHNRLRPRTPLAITGG